MPGLDEGDFQALRSLQDEERKPAALKALDSAVETFMACGSREGVNLVVSVAKKRIDELYRAGSKSVQSGSFINDVGILDRIVDKLAEKFRGTLTT